MFKKTKNRGIPKSCMLGKHFYFLANEHKCRSNMYDTTFTKSSINYQSSISSVIQVIDSKNNTKSHDSVSMLTYYE